MGSVAEPDTAEATVAAPSCDADCWECAAESQPTVLAGATRTKELGAVSATPLAASHWRPVSDQLRGAKRTTSCSTADRPVELDGGPGGRDAAGATPRDVVRRAGSESGSETESSAWVCTLCTWRTAICKSMLARSREMRRLASVRERREWRRHISHIMSQQQQQVAAQRGSSAHSAWKSGLSS